MIGIIDVRIGNLRSVYNALAYLGLAAEYVSKPEALEKYERLILPGVGAYSLAMDNLRQAGFEVALHDYVAQGHPLLGICLGMQLLSSTGSEPDPCQGLNLITGDVLPLPVAATTPLPHVGWNSLKLRYDHPVFRGVRKDADVYFVHSYAFQPERSQDILCTSEYDIEFVSGVANRNIVGLQFHPEKSQAMGLKILENFCVWDGTC